MSQAGAIVVAANVSQHSPGYDAPWATLVGKPLFTWALDVFVRMPEIATTVLVVVPERLEAARDLAVRVGWRAVHVVGVDGARWRDAVRVGLGALPEGLPWVVVHDATRPLVSPALIVDTLEAARLAGAAVAAEPVTDTLKRVVRGVVVETLPRAELARLQTPQAFRRDVLQAALERVSAALDPPDDISFLLALCAPIRVVASGPENMAVRTPDDLAIVTSALATGGHARPLADR